MSMQDAMMQSIINGFLGVVERLLGPKKDEVVEQVYAAVRKVNGVDDKLEAILEGNRILYATLEIHSSMLQRLLAGPDASITDRILGGIGILQDDDTPLEVLMQNNGDLGHGGSNHNSDGNVIRDTPGIVIDFPSPSGIASASGVG